MTSTAAELAAGTCRFVFLQHNAQDRKGEKRHIDIEYVVFEDTQKDVIYHEIIAAKCTNLGGIPRRITRRHDSEAHIHEFQLFS